jgi:hypothetical protein
VRELEAAIDAADAELPPLRAFVLPAGAPKAAALHLARTVCRRAERAVVRLAHEHEVPPLFVVYLNRLSDLLFTLARLANHREGAGDTTWLARWWSGTRSGATPSTSSRGALAAWARSPSATSGAAASRSSPTTP